MWEVFRMELKEQLQKALVELRKEKEMKVNIEIKSLLIGFLLAMVVVLVMGQAYGGADTA